MEAVKEIKQIKCSSCDELKAESNVHDIAIYLQFESEPEFKGLLCERCYDNSDISFCSLCHREIFNSIGYRRNIRINKQDEPECVSCLQKHWRYTSSRS